MQEITQGYRRPETPSPEIWDLTGDGARRGQQRPRPAMPDEDRGLAEGAAGYHPGLPHAVRRPCRKGARQVRDTPLPPAPVQVSGDQIPGSRPHQRTMNEQQPGNHAPIRISHAGVAGVAAWVTEVRSGT